MQMRLDIFLKTGVMACIIVGMASVSCKKDNPVAPAVKNFHITYPQNGDTFSWGKMVTIKWTLPADSSIETVFVYTKKPGQPEEIQNQYFPVVAPADTFEWYVPSDTGARNISLGIQNKLDSTQRDEVAVHISF
jgi:hypothetical protein